MALPAGITPRRVGFLTTTSPTLVLAFGSLMSLGSGAFMAGNWARIARDIRR